MSTTTRSAVYTNFQGIFSWVGSFSFRCLAYKSTLSLKKLLFNLFQNFCKPQFFEKTLQISHILGYFRVAPNYTVQVKFSWVLIMI